ncbi:MAG: hypothetical protein Q4D81_03865 [Eubacteriales bacterium]|nr:hypothetical protein [Eubacteriales bacterium]
MTTILGYPDRVTRQKDGTYQWYCEIEVDYYRNRSIYPAIWICGGIALFVLLYGLILSLQFDGGKSMMVVLLCTAVFIAISAVVIRLYGWGTGKTPFEPREMYILTDDFVKSGSGKSAEYIDFKRVREMVIKADYLELIEKHRRKRIYVPAEDMPFVRTFIMGRVPGDAEIRYEQNM